jgi:protein-disulfide isomerase
MASRTKQKEEARARRMAEEQARVERERSRRRLQMLGGVVLAAVAIVAVAIAISSGGGGTAKKATPQVVNSVEQLLAGIPQSGARLGNPHAPVTMYYYGDLQCPICQDFTLNGGWPQLVQNDVRAGRVKVIYRGFETATPDQQTFQTEQVAALAAGKQDRFWDYVELFYHDQGQEGTGYVTESFLTDLANKVPGFNLAAWRNARNDASLLAQVQADSQAGTVDGVKGTPTLVFQGPKGKTAPPAGVPSYSDLQQAIKQVS